MLRNLTVSIAIAVLLSSCAPSDKQVPTDEHVMNLAAGFARDSVKCAAVLKEHPDMLVDIGDPDFDVIAKTKTFTTHEETAYKLPKVRRSKEGFNVTFWHNGRAYDSTSYFIDVYLAPKGTLRKIDVREEPGGFE
jgi:hypothetical protein